MVTPLTEKKAFRVIKQEIRVLGIDDGKFKPHTKGDVIVVGVVFRGGVSIDGIMHTHVAIDGLDATEKLTVMINESPHKHQLRLVMLNGVTLAGFNLVDLPKLHADTGLPVIALTQVKPDLENIHAALGHLPDSEARWQIIQDAGQIHEVTNNGSMLYMGLAGIGLSEALVVLDLTTVRGGLPEPLRVAHLIASGVTP
jgi:uncharacterized protein